MRVALWTRNQRDQETLDRLESWARQRYGHDILVVRGCTKKTRSELTFEQMLDLIDDGHFQAFVCNTVADVTRYQGEAVDGQTAYVRIELALRQGRLQEYCMGLYDVPQRLQTVAEVVAEHFPYADPEEVVEAARSARWLLSYGADLAAIDAVNRAADVEDLRRGA